VGSKTLLQQNPPVLNWESQLTQVDLYTGREMVDSSSYFHNLMHNELPKSQI